MKLSIHQRITIKEMITSRAYQKRIGVDPRDLEALDMYKGLVHLLGWPVVIDYFVRNLQNQ